VFKPYSKVHDSGVRFGFKVDSCPKEFFFEVHISLRIEPLGKDKHGNEEDD